MAPNSIQFEILKSLFMKQYIVSVTDCVVVWCSGSV